MLKLIGAVMVFGSCAAFGFLVARQLALRPRQLLQLEQMLRVLETEIVYRSTPLPFALRHLAERFRGPLADLFGQAAANLEEMDGADNRLCWERAVQQYRGALALKEGDWAILLELAATLGRSDRLHQQRHIAAACAHLRAEEAMAREDQRRYEKMAKSLGVLTGLLVVLLMY